MKFLCDEMLADLARWLRAAGYDTLIADKGMADIDIYENALKKHRLLLTRDRHFLKIPHSDHIVVWLQANGLEECIKLLNCRIKINWLLKPFSRCLICNNLLVVANASEKENVPLDVLKRDETIWYCPNCVQPFWAGSHTKHMLQKLTEWQNLR